MITTLRQCLGKIGEKPCTENRHSDVGQKAAMMEFHPHFSGSDVPKKIFFVIYMHI